MQLHPVFSLFAVIVLIFLQFAGTPIPARAASAQEGEPVRKAGTRETSRTIVERLQKKYEGTKTLKARFEQENQLRSLGRTTHSKGTLLLDKPGRIRVEYTEPEKQYIISDGRTLWIYTESLNQVILSRIEGMGVGSVPLLFLAGKGNLNEAFRVVVEDKGLPGREGGVWKAGQPYRLLLVPKKESPGFTRMWLEVDPESFQISGLDYLDPLGNKTQIRFYNIEENVDIDDNSFHFDIPSGVEVLRTPGSGGTR